MPARPETAAVPHRPPGSARRTARDEIFKSAFRVVGVNVALIALYWLLPFGQRLSGGVPVWLGVGLLVFIAVAGWELRAINHSRYPELRAVEAVGIALPVALLPFAATYFTLARNVAGSFDAHLTRLDALYFTVTTFATVGYGDIAPKSEMARAVVTGQMTVDLLLIGVIAKAIVGTARRRRDALVEDEPQR